MVIHTQNHAHHIPLSGKNVPFHIFLTCPGNSPYWQELKTLISKMLGIIVPLDSFKRLLASPLICLNILENLSSIYWQQVWKRTPCPSKQNYKAELKRSSLEKHHWTSILPRVSRGVGSLLTKGIVKCYTCFTKAASVSTNYKHFIHVVLHQPKLKPWVTLSAPLGSTKTLKHVRSRVEDCWPNCDCI